MERVWRRHARDRLFENDVLEWVSKVHPALPFLVFIPVSVGALAWGLATGRTSAPWSLVFFPLGMVAWQLAEYGIHRFAFHWEGRGPWGRRLHHILHGYHHLYPDDPMRLVMPLSVSIPLAVLLATGLSALDAPRATLPFFSGFVLAYLGYDFFHWYVHARKPRGDWGRAMHAHHMVHHFARPDRNFGISNRWVDRLAGTFEARGNRADDRFSL